jgi:hypothetical protein
MVFGGTKTVRRTILSESPSLGCENALKIPNPEPLPIEDGTVQKPLWEYLSGELHFPSLNHCSALFDPQKVFFFLFPRVTGTVNR